MKKNIYAVFDSKANLHLDFFRADTDGVAVRLMTEALKNPQSIISKYPGDYSLWRIGVFDDEQAKFENLERALKIVDCSSLVVPVGN